MKKTLTFYRDKTEVFKCSAQIEGAKIEESFVRLCLEFENGRNMYFNGNLRADGTITVSVPALKEVKEDKGIAKLEVIADSVYFRPFEDEFNLTEAVKVTIQEPEVESEIIENKKTKITVKFDDDIDSDNIVINEKTVDNKKDNVKTIKSDFQTFNDFFKK